MGSLESIYKVKPKYSKGKIEFIDCMEFVTYEVEVSGRKEIVVITKIDEQKSIIIDASNVENTYDKDILRKVTPVLKTIEKSLSIK